MYCLLRPSFEIQKNRCCSAMGYSWNDLQFLEVNSWGLMLGLWVPQLILIMTTCITTMSVWNKGVFPWGANYSVSEGRCSLHSYFPQVTPVHGLPDVWTGEVMLCLGTCGLGWGQVSPSFPCPTLNPCCRDETKGQDLPWDLPVGDGNFIRSPGVCTLRKPHPGILHSQLTLKQRACHNVFPLENKQQQRLLNPSKPHSQSSGQPQTFWSQHRWQRNACRRPPPPPAPELRPCSLLPPGR